MKKKLIGVLLVLGVSYFCGYMVFAVGIGSVYPDLNQIARPVVCGDQKMEVDQSVGHYRPGETTWSVRAFCVDQDGARRDVTGLVQLLVGAIFSLIPLGIILLGWLWISVKLPAAESKAAPDLRAQMAANLAMGGEGAGSAPLAGEQVVEDRLLALKGLYDRNLISDEDYQRKKEEILRGV